VLCLDCGNCRKGDALFYCTAKNEFIANEVSIVREKSRERWRKGDPGYEQHRRQLRKDKIPQTG
jgi:hypothetical protein